MIESLPPRPHFSAPLPSTGQIWICKWKPKIDPNFCCKACLDACAISYQIADELAIVLSVAIDKYLSIQQPFADMHIQH